MRNSFIREINNIDPNEFIIQFDLVDAKTIHGLNEHAGRFVFSKNDGQPEDSTID
jgi:hypothetical protein